MVQPIQSARGVASGSAAEAAAAARGQRIVAVGSLDDFVPAPGHDLDGILLLEVEQQGDPERWAGGALGAGWPRTNPVSLGPQDEDGRWTGEALVVYRTRSGRLFALQVRLQ